MPGSKWKRSLKRPALYEKIVKSIAKRRGHSKPTQADKSSAAAISNSKAKKG